MLVWSFWQMKKSKWKVNFTFLIINVQNCLVPFFVLFFDRLTIAGLVGKLNPKNKVDLTNPELTIIVEVIKAVCCLSVVKDYTLYRKYNVQEVVKEDTPKPDVTTAQTDTNTAEEKAKHDAEETNEEEKKKGEEDNGNNVPQDNKEADKDEGDGE